MTAVAYKVMMPVQTGIIARGFAFTGHLPHQAGLRQIPEAVVDRRAGYARIAPVQRFKNLIRSRMNRAPYQILQHVQSLGRAT